MKIDKRFKHKFAKTYRKEYRVWHGMRKRCRAKNSQNFKYYGGSGISVCEKWNKSFDAFLKDVGPIPSKKHTIDRIDNSKGYEPGNVRWSTHSEQMRNRKIAIKILKPNGNTTTIVDLSKEYKIKYSTIYRRLKNGKSFNEIIAKVGK